MTDAQGVARLTDHQAVALTIWAEARNEPIEGQIAVGCVIRNRLRRPQRFGATWRAVCLRRLQFSCWWPVGGAVNHQRLMVQVTRLLDGHAPEPRSSLAVACWVADGVMLHGVPDVTGGADHYLTSALLHAAPPAWVRSPARQTSEIGNHAFFTVP